MRTLIFTSFLMIMLWATDFAVLMWNLNLDKAQGTLPLEVVIFVWIFCILLDIKEINYEN